MEHLKDSKLYDKEPVSYKGYIVHYDSTIIRLDGKAPLKPYLNSKGRPRIRLRGKQWFVSRLIATLFHPNPKRKKQVNHKDKNVLNNHGDNLEWMTATENSNHKWATVVEEKYVDVPF